jgi:hypothetical protein
MMAATKRGRLNDQIEQLVKWRFIGYPYEAGDEIAAYRAELMKSDPENIDFTFRHEQDRMEFDPLFCDPLNPSDISFWCKARFWKIDEAAALLFGKDPDKVNRPDILSSHYSENSFYFTKEYFRVCTLMERAQEAGQMSRTSTPGAFLTWAKRVGIPYPPELEKQVLLHGHAVIDWMAHYKELKAKSDREIDRLKKTIEELQKVIDKAQAGDKPLHAKERNSMLKMIGGMAIAYHGYDTQAERSTTVSEITADLLRIGIDLSDDTVRKYLIESKELLPRPASPAPGSTD